MSTRDLIEHPVDFVLLKGNRSPGIATIEGGELRRRLRERQAFGIAAARVIDQGAQLCPFTVRLVFTTGDDLEKWDEWKRLLVRPATRQTVGQDIEHPILADLEIRACLFESRTQLTQDDDGGWSVAILFKEYRRPVPALGAPNSTESAPLDPLERAIAAETDTFAALADPEQYGRDVIARTLPGGA
jgi:hypothetical protein